MFKLRKTRTEYGNTGLCGGENYVRTVDAKTGEILSTRYLGNPNDPSSRFARTLDGVVGLVAIAVTIAPFLTYCSPSNNQDPQRPNESRLLEKSPDKK